jgi:hypothetical protein
MMFSDVARRSTIRHGCFAYNLEANLLCGFTVQYVCWIKEEEHEVDPCQYRIFVRRGILGIDYIQKEVGEELKWI